MTLRRIASCLTLVFVLTWCMDLYCQNHSQHATVILFRTFDIFSFDRSYKLYADDSLLGRMKTKDVFILDTYSQGISLHAKTTAPSLNASRESGYRKQKKINYPVTLTPGRVYFVKCGYLTQNLFDLPRQPTIRLLKPAEVRKYLKRRFLRRRIKDHLYEKWLHDKVNLVY